MKRPKTFDFTLKPRKPNGLFMGILKTFVAYPDMKKRDFECEYVNMDGIEPPYFLLANHASEMDFRILYAAIRPHNMNYVVAIDAMHDNGIGLMRFAGGIGKRKFIQDMALIRNMKYCVDNYKNPLCIYPEARYTFDGTQSYIPPSVGKMAKLLKVPVVLLIAEGNFICCPQWNKDKFKKRLAPCKAKLICVADKNEVQALTAEEINARIKEHFVYDDFAYQYKNKISLTFPQRARGLHHILYQCCECGTGTHFYCNWYGEKFEMHLAPNQLESVHIEFDYRDRKKNEFFGDCLDISRHDDSFWLHPVNIRDCIMKISFATEELYQLEHRRLKEKRKQE